MIVYIGLKGNVKTFFRVMTLIRPLRLIYAFPILKRSLDALFRTLPELSKNVLSLICIMLFYAILGLHMFSGAMEYRCRLSPEPIDGEWPPDPNSPFSCGNWKCPEKYNFLLNMKDYYIK